MSHTIRIDGIDEHAPAEDGDTILDALLMAGVGFGYSCQAGNCGSCKCELVSGEVVELEYSEHALAPAERARGLVLACRSQVWSDVTVRKLHEEEFTAHPSRVLNCRLDSLDRLTHDTWRLRLAIESGGPFAFSAGQYAELEFPFAPGQPRQYSIASRPDEPLLEFHVRESAGGTTAALGGRLAAGALLRVIGPHGHAYLRRASDVPIIAIGGGSGIAPLRAILSARRREGARAPLHLYFGVRSERDVYAEAELRELVETVPGSSMNVVLSEPEPSEPEAGSRRRTGLVTEAVDRDFTSLAGFRAYLSGPPAMVEAAAALLQRKGVAARDIHSDAFTGAQPAREAA
jgi:CDP-4-dehydro-6-deoxyglucose reductase/ferredoxin-NAD(P)+ reductase (naphthalene dioxygenase ferredoxin-specific)